MRILATVALVVSATLLLNAQGQPTFRANTNLLVVTAIVRDADNNLLRGLSREAFELFEDGKPVTIATFAEASTDAKTSVDDGRFIVLLLDNLNIDPLYTSRIKGVAHEFANRMGPKDIMSVLLLDGGSGVTTQRPSEIHAAIDRTKGYGRGILSGNPSSNAKHTMQTIATLSRQLARVAHRRKVLVCIGAMSCNTPTHIEGYKGDAGTAMRESARANVTTYVIDPLGLNEKASLSPRAIDDGGIDEENPNPDAKQPGVFSKGGGFRISDEGFAFESGGYAFSNTNDYESAINRVWEESGNYYLIGYEPAQRDNKPHAIEVRLKTGGATVRARRTRG